MIDTTKLKINVQDDDAIKIKLMANKYLVNDEGKLKGRYFNGDLLIPCFYRDIHYELHHRNDQYSLYLEFSVPKLYYGHNLYLFYPDKLDAVMFEIELAINDTFGISVPPFPTWIVQRLDVCYVWQLSTHDFALAAFLAFTPFDYPRKNEVFYETGFIQRGSVSTIRMYAKYDEFMKKDYRKILLDDPLKAQKLARLCLGSLRFEVQYRVSKLKQLFNNKIVKVEDIGNQEVLENILKQELKILLHSFQPKIITKQITIDLIKKQYPSDIAFHLVLFYLAYLNHKDKTFLKHNFNKTTINRYLKQLAEAGAGLLTNDLLQFDFTIPSPHVINKVNQNPKISPTYPIHEIPGIRGIQEPLMSGS